jgi:cbb3-type cytochrome oxidase subunit 3
MGEPVGDTLSVALTVLFFGYIIWAFQRRRPVS